MNRVVAAPQNLLLSVGVLVKRTFSAVLALTHL